MDEAEALGVAIESERVAAVMSRDELAEAAGVSLDTIGRHIRGEQDAAGRLRAIAKALDCTPQELLDRADGIVGRAQRRTATQSVEGDGNLAVGGNIENSTVVVGDTTTQAEGRS